MDDIINDINFYIEYIINRINDNETIEDDDKHILNIFDDELFDLLNNGFNENILHILLNYNTLLNYNGFVKSINFIKPTSEIIMKNIVDYIYCVINQMKNIDYEQTIKIAEIGLLLNKSFNEWLFENAHGNDKIKYGLIILEQDISFKIYQQIKHLISKQKIINLIDINIKKNNKIINFNIINILFDLKEYQKIFNFIEQFNYPTEELYNIYSQLIINNLFHHKNIIKHLKILIESPLSKKKSLEYNLSIKFIYLLKIYINNNDIFDKYIKHILFTYNKLNKFVKLLN
jgi:hypothetical protein